MLWIIPLAALTLFAFACLRCGNSKNSVIVSEDFAQTLGSCEEVLCSIEREKSQLQARLAMLDELIEKSDRVIEQATEQLSRVHALRDDSPDLTEQEMLQTLSAEGYSTYEIARMTGRAPHQIRKAA